jgi:hypothetical protein
MPRKATLEKTRCNIHENLDERVKEHIRPNLCQNLLAQYPYKEKLYCLLHYPSKDKDIEAFEKEFHKRLEAKNYNFNCVYFPIEINLSYKKIDSPINFRLATFSKSVEMEYSNFLGEVYFNGTIFSSSASFACNTFNQKAFFSRAFFAESVFFANSEFRQNVFFDKSTFEKNADFKYAKFKQEALFKSTTFNLLADFQYAEFSQNNYFNSTNFAKNVYFRYANFEEGSQVFFTQILLRGAMKFHLADIKGNLYFTGGEDEDFSNKLITMVFEGDNALLDLQNARIKNPEQISFHSVRLQPNWFINVDCRKFVFTNCYWKKANGNEIDTKHELNILKSRKIPSLHSILSRTCWQLADNYEENKSFLKASLFRQTANETMRLKEYKGFKFWSLHWWYWLSSFYGESWQRAFAILFAIWMIFTVIYTQTDFNVCQQLQVCETRKLFVGEAMKQSFGAMFLQKSEYRKPLEAAETFTLVENILAPLQAALLALAIRRKFMR